MNTKSKSTATIQIIKYPKFCVKCMNEGRAVTRPCRLHDIPTVEKDYKTKATGERDD